MGYTFEDYSGECPIRWHMNERHEVTGVERIQDVAPILDYAQCMRSNADYLNNNKEFQSVGVIPIPLAEELFKEGRWDDPVAMDKWLNDSDFSKLRTGGGRL